MADVGTMTTAIVLVLALVQVLVSAKFHGRQVRLRREADGHMHVTFRGENPPYVEAMWRRDRRTFWPTFLVLGAAGLAWVASAAAGLGWVARAEVDGLALPAMHVAGLVPWVLAMAFSAAFLAVGFGWSVALARSRHTTSLVMWLQSLGWLLAALALLAAQIVVLGRAS